MKQLINLKVNGELYEVAADPRRTLLEVLRDELGLTGTKKGCDSGDCGACTVLLDGKAVTSCLVLAVEASGKEVLTIEGLATDGHLHPLQTAFAEHGAVQCGYCTPGIIMAGVALLAENPDPSEEQIAEALEGHICRCGVYQRIVAATRQAAEAMKGGPR